MSNLAFLYIALGIFVNGANAQSKGGVEQYNYLTRSGIDVFMPVVHVESKTGWHAEARYNYEELKTFSLYVGKSFSHTGFLDWTATPMAGVLFGNLKGASTAFNINVEHKKIFFSASPEFVIATDPAHRNFFYNWSEFGYSIGRMAYAGLTVQQTITGHSADTEPGITAGLRIRSFSFPIYFFDPLQQRRYLIVGINWQWDKTSRNPL